jgi:hypothetical protein
MKQNSRLFALGFALALSTPAFAALKTLTFQKDILPREARAWEYDKQSLPNANTDVKFALVSEPEIIDGAIQLRGVLTNSSSSKKTVYIQGDKEPLKVDLVLSDKIKLRDPKKQNPPMFAIEIPAQSEIKLIGSTPLDRYIIDGTPDATVTWSFLFWNPPRPHGEFKLKLPTSTEAKAATFRIELQKFTGDDQAKIAASLRNVSNDPQIFCRSSQVNFNWNLKNVDSSEIKSIEHSDVRPVFRPISESDCSVIKPNGSLELETANVKKDGATYRFETPYVTWKDLKPGQYNVWFQAQNRALTADAKIIASLKSKSLAAAPTKSIETTEVTQSVSIP